MLNKKTMAHPSKQNENWRQFYLPGDIKQARLGTLLLGVIIVAFVFNDYQFFRLSSVFYGLLVLRLSILAVCMYMFIKVGSSKTYQYYDKLVSFSSLIIIAGCGVINMTSPENFIVQIILTGISIFLLYLVIPNNFVNQFLLSTTMTIGEIVVVLVFLQPTEIPMLFTVFLTLVFANIVAIFSSWQLRLYRIKSYEDYVKRQELQITLEQHLKQLERLVEERTEKLKGAERLAAIGATAGMVGHDLRNPLMAVTGASFLAKKKLKSFPDSEAKRTIEKNLELIREQTVYMDKIVADLQNYAAPMNPKFEQTSLHQLALSVLSTLNIPRGISVECLIDDEFPKVKTDQYFMKRILTNLSNNAIQAMPDGGKLTIVAAKQEKKIAIFVKDTGCGISEEIKSKLFTPLVTTKAKGQGFGLAVVKRLTEALGGTVTFETVIGQGTKFEIILPQ